MTTHSATQSLEIDVADEALRDLHQRLAMTRYPDRIDGSGFGYGMDLDVQRFSSSTGATETTGARERPGPGVSRPDSGRGLRDARHRRVDAATSNWVATATPWWEATGARRDRRSTSTRAISSERLYFESAKHQTSALDPWDGRVHVPTGHAVYPPDLLQTPSAWAERHYNIVHWSVQPRGGHFAQFEQPVGFTEDLRVFGRLFR